MKLARYKTSSPYSYALGATLTFELLNTHPEQIQRVFLRPDIKHGDDLEQIIQKLQQRHIEVIESTKAFNIQNAKDSCLMMAEFQKPSQRLDDDLPHIVLVNPSDAGNLGTIMRTAAAFGYQNLAIILPAVDAFSPKAIRASMGAVFHLKVQIFNDMQEYINQYGANRRQLFAFMLDKDATSLENISTPAHNYSLVFGNEASGLPKDFATWTGAMPIFIPQSSQVDSLNLSVAASIAIYHFANKTTL
jgi:TrmH family RNA methyltransferase